MGIISRRVLARYLRAKSDKKRMIVMMGPPAAGKGFFLGEPPPKFGWKLPKMLVDDEGKPLLTEEDVPERPTADESDNYLRALQGDEATEHFKVLKAAHEQGEEAFNKAMEDHWYATKDGGRVDLGHVIKYKDFPADDFKKYYDKTKKDFYVSMRGWHDDPSEVHEVTGKPKERFKDAARHLFDESVTRKIEEVEDMLIVDSAGEDIDAQDYRGQIEQAKEKGFEVTVIFLHPEQADTELSNLARGKVQGKRMVDQSDITNWYERNAEALQDIQLAAPDNFCHYRKPPPDDDPKKAGEIRAKARDTMNKLSQLEGDEKKKASDEVKKVLYELAPYKLQKKTSYGASLSGLPKKPEVESLANAVEEMNVDAQKRAKAAEPSTTKSPVQEKEEPGKAKAGPAKKDKPKTQQNFLREMGDKKVPNPNPENRDRTPQIKIRSLPWMYQKPYYERWSQRQAAIRVLDRYRGKMAGKRWLESWMGDLAEEIGKLTVEDYEIKAEAGKGPEVFVTIAGASEDTTTARKVRQEITKIMEASIGKNAHGIPGFKPQVRAYNKGADLLVECTVIFP